MIILRKLTPQSSDVTYFTDLDDTPATYSGSEGHYVKVKSDGSGLNFTSSDANETQEGITNLDEGASYAVINYTTPFSDNNYILLANLANNSDLEPSIYPFIIKDKTEDGFTVVFAGEMDTSNYYLHWRATK